LSKGGKIRLAAATFAAAALMLATGCSDVAPTRDPQGESTPDAAATPGAGGEPSSSLAQEWSANGFEQLDARYQWTGSGTRDDVFEPNLSLSVPETDDAIWSSSCAAGGKVETRLNLAPPKGMKDSKATFRFETDTSAATRSYPARYVADGQYDGFAIVQRADDPMFAEMKAGRWAYFQIGEGSVSVKLRVSLAGAARSLGAFLPACIGAARQAARPAAASTTVSYACEDGRSVMASYLGNDTDAPTARLTIDGEVVLLSQAIAGSGARYEGERAGVRVIWLTKADEGSLIMANAGDAEGASEQTVRCSAP
jgi:membrane-bound inhibitor of C-type lysozyme